MYDYDIKVFLPQKRSKLKTKIGKENLIFKDMMDISCILYQTKL